MPEARGDIWVWAQENDAEVVIPTSIGWDADGSNVMNRGLAAQCANSYPDIPAWYGAICQACGPATPVVIHPEHSLIFFPTTPLDYDDPEMSWNGQPSPWLIQRSAHQLAVLRLGSVAVPIVGCGDGGLREMDIMPIVRDILGGYSHFTIVRPPSSLAERRLS